MCLIIVKPAGAAWDMPTIEQALVDNPDGVGVMFMLDGKPHHLKGLYSEEWLEGLLYGLGDREVSLHFRYATHGVVSTDNCHPFLLPDGSLVMHNGIIPGYGSPKRSDTRHFCEEWLAPFAHGEWWRHAELLKAIEATIGYSKMVILTPTGETVIIGEHKGVWAEGCWYSNSFSFPRVGKPEEEEEETTDPLADVLDVLCPTCVRTVVDVYDLCYECESTVMWMRRYGDDFWLDRVEGE